MYQYFIVMKLNAWNKCVPTNTKSQNHFQYCIVNAQQKRMSSSFKCITSFLTVSFRLGLIHIFDSKNYILAKTIITTAIYRLWL